MNKIKIAEVLKTLRKEHHFTQEELAEKLYVSAKTVSRWETGSNLPDIGILIELADLYQVDIRDIILCERRCKTVNDEMIDVASKVADYSSADKEATAKRTIIASVMGLAAFAIGFLLMILGTGFLSFIALVAFAITFGSLCYILFNSTKKYSEANWKKAKRANLLYSVLIAVAALLFFLTAVTSAWFIRV